MKTSFLAAVRSLAGPRRRAPGGAAQVLTLLLGVWFVALPGAAQVPGIITYQGKLNVSGGPFTGTAQFKFALVSAGGGTTFWSYNNTGNGGTEPADPPIPVNVTNGLFSVNLGDLTVSNMTLSIPPSLFTNSAVYLRIWVNDRTNGSVLLAPDQRITAVGYAMTAANVVGPVASATNFTGLLAGDVTGTQGATVVGAVGGQSAANVAAGVALANGATSLNAPNTLVRRDSQGNFAAGRLAGAFIGDGSSLTNLNAASVIGQVPSAISFLGSLAGDVTGPQWATTVGVVGGQNAANVAAGVALANGATSLNAPNTLVRRDSQGNFLAGRVAGAFVGDGSGLTNLSAPSSVALPSGAAVVSMLAQDASLLAAGYQLVMTIAPPVWINGATTGAPTARSGQAAVWDGQELIVWGGNVSPPGFVPVSSGGMYRPDLDQWQALTPVGAPAPRAAHTAVWTGSRMLVWGGNGTNGYLNTGGQFQPSNQPWTATTTLNAPAGRSGHIAVWTGSRMVVWGGQNVNGLLGDGALYDPVGDQWTTLNLANAPAARSGADALWAGDRLLLWGGLNELGGLNTGAQLRFSPNGLPVAWTAASTSAAPSGRSLHSVVWTGQKMLVWGGFSGSAPLGDGAAYDPAADSWSPLSLANAPSARYSHSALWTGQEMLVFGGETSSGTASDGAAYDPATDSWRTLTTAGAPLARSAAAAAWSGTQFLVFAGSSAGQPLAALQLLNPQPPWYLYRKL